MKNGGRDKRRAEERRGGERSEGQRGQPVICTEEGCGGEEGGAKVSKREAAGADRVRQQEQEQGGEGKQEQVSS